MSHAPIDRKHTPSLTPALLARALRRDFRTGRSAVKQIARLTGVYPTTARKWYDGDNLPQVAQILLLVKSSPSIRAILLSELVGGTRSSSSPQPAGQAVYPDTHVRVNLRLAPELLAALNGRQIWFIGRMQDHEAVSAGDLAITWAVSARTAWRDIQGLQALGVIVFLGARKNGCYVLRPLEGFLPGEDPKAEFESLQGGGNSQQS